jgi:hypothetical protein
MEELEYSNERDSADNISVNILSWDLKLKKLEHYVWISVDSCKFGLQNSPCLLSFLWLP